MKSTYFAAFLMVFTLVNPSVLAQVMTDGSTGTQVIEESGNFSVVGGTQRGANLFHSFQQLSLTNGQSIHFLSNSDTSNIFSRVTGGFPSVIDGSINSTSNLYFINPFGILFGANARLNINGNFMASTASSIGFQDGGEFNAVNPEQSILTISIPNRLDFRNSAGSIRVSNIGHQLIGDAPGFVPLIQSSPLSGLSGGKFAVALIGGNLNLDGGIVSARQLSLGSVQQGEVSFSFSTDVKGWTFDYSRATQLGSIILNNRSLVVANGLGANEIRVYGDLIKVLNGSLLLTQNITNVPDNGIKVSGRDIEIAGISASTPSGIISDTFSMGRGGDIFISGDKLNIGVGGVVRTIAYRSGSGGDIFLNSDFVSLSSQRLSPLATLVITGTLGTGKGGNISVDSRDVSVVDGANFGTTTYGRGNSGNFVVKADNILVSGFNQQNVFRFPSIALPNSSSIGSLNLGSGQSGDVSITSNNITLLDGAVMGSQTLLTGNLGNTIIKANSIFLDGNKGYPLFNTSQIQNVSAGLGSTGNLEVTGNRIVVQGGGRVSIFALSRGAAGNLVVKANDIILSGVNPSLAASGISTSSYSDVNSGDLMIDANTIHLDAGATIEAASFATGDAGNIFIRANQLTLSGSASGALNPTRISASISIIDPSLRVFFPSLPDIPSGSSGNISVNVPRVIIRDGAAIIVSNQGTGDGGTLNINTQKIELYNGGKLESSTLSGKGGDINIDGHQLFLDHGLIAATSINSGNGGNIAIQSHDVILANNSQIFANANMGDGGNIRITSPILFVSGDSEINASSNLGIDGQVIVNSQNFNPETPILTIDSKFVLPTQAIVSQCLILPDSIVRLQPTAPSEMLTGINLPIISNVGEEASYHPVLLENEGTYLIGGLTSNCSPN